MGASSREGSLANLPIPARWFTDEAKGAIKGIIT
jgi:hypothetical protein